MIKIFEEVRKTQDLTAPTKTQERYILSRRSSKGRIAKKDASPNTEYNEFDDRKLFTPTINKSLHVVG